MTSGTTRPTRSHARSERARHHRRTTGPTGAHAWRKWARENRYPSRKGSFGTAGEKHPVVMAEGLIVTGDGGAGEEDNRHDEDNAGDDHDPCRNLVEPRRPR